MAERVFVQLLTLVENGFDFSSRMKLRKINKNLKAVEERARTAATNRRLAYRIIPEIVDALTEVVNWQYMLYVNPFAMLARISLEVAKCKLEELRIFAKHVHLPIKHLREEAEEYLRDQWETIGSTWSWSTMSTWREVQYQRLNLPHLTLENVFEKEMHIQSTFEILDHYQKRFPAIQKFRVAHELLKKVLANAAELKYS